MQGVLNLRALSAEFAKDSSHFGKQNPFCEFIIGKQEFQTGVDKKGGKTPHWNQLFAFNITGNEHLLIVHVYDKEFHVDFKIAEGSLEVKDLLHSGKNGHWIELKHSLKLVGKLLVELEFIPMATCDPILPVEEEMTLNKMKESVKDHYASYKEKVTEKIHEVKDKVHSHHSAHVDSDKSGVDRFPDKIRGAVTSLAKKLLIDKNVCSGGKVGSTTTEKISHIKDQVMEKASEMKDVILEKYSDIRHEGGSKNEVTDSQIDMFESLSIKAQPDSEIANADTDFEPESAFPKDATESQIFTQTVTDNADTHHIHGHIEPDFVDQIEGTNNYVDKQNNAPLDLLNMDYRENSASPTKPMKHTLNETKQPTVFLKKSEEALHTHMD